MTKTDSTARLRAWWSHKQGLDGRLQGADPAAVLAASGWARGLGGVSPYLALYARAGISREAADAAVNALEIHELPAARNCTYVVPAADYAVALKAGAGFSTDVRTVGKLGVPEREIEQLCAKVEAALAKGPLEPDAIRDAVGPAVRNLGEEGKKKGVTTTLPVALGVLQTEGRIRRISLNGRFDQQRYKYALWKPGPLAGTKLTAEQTAIELARRYFRWTGPATLSDFQTFSGWSQKVAKAAIEPLKLVSVEGDLLLLPEDCDAFAAFQPPKTADYRLVSGIDGIRTLRSGAPSIVDDADQKRIAALDLKGYGPSELIGHMIVDRGRMAGIWEFNPETESIVSVPFIARNKDLEKAVARTEQFIREQLGDARSFSLDSIKSRAPRLAALSKAAGK
jgi:hypothetical protein